MRYKSCSYIEHGILFSTESVWHCCHLVGRGFDGEKICDFDGKNFDIEVVKEVKRKKREAYKRGEISPCCQNCIYLHEEDWDEEEYINQIFLSHWTKCNSNCSYCFTSKDKKYFNSFEEYPMIPILEEMKNQNYLRFNGTVWITGGEATELKEFEQIIDFFENNSQNHYFIQSSGIKYSEKIEKILESGKGEVNISPDSGSNDTYKKIKQVDEYEQVFENIRKYNGKTHENSVFISKYVILPEANDNLKDLDLWLDACFEAGLKHVAIDMESSFMQMYPKRIPEIIPQLIEHAKARCNEKNVDFQIYSNAHQLLHNLENGTCALIKENPVKREYLSCGEFLHSICFMPEGIRHCMYMNPNDAPPVISVSQDIAINPEYVLETKHEYERERMEGKMDETCKKCFLACKKVHENQDYINKVLISHRKDCNAECVFCYNRFDEDLTKNPYPIMPQLEAFKKYFKNGCEMHFGGGEPTIWEEFEDMIDFAIKENFTKIFIASNGSVFSQKLADAMKMGKVQLVVTTDIADSLLFRNLKGISFEDVTENLKKYIEYDVTGHSIQNKYVIVPNINDNEKYIKEWIEYNEKLGVKNLAIDIDAIFFNQNREHIPQRYKAMIEFAENLINEKGMNCILYNFAQQMKYDDKK